MLRLALLVTLAVVLWRMLENTLGEWLRDRLPSGSEDSRSKTVQGESLVRCDICGVHVPRSRALTAPGSPGTKGPVYCSDVCRRAGVSGVC